MEKKRSSHYSVTLNFCGHFTNSFNMTQEHIFISLYMYSLAGSWVKLGMMGLMLLCNGGSELGKGIYWEDGIQIPVSICVSVP
jgi:hypothetical protein